MNSENTSSCHRYEIDVSAIPGEWWLTDPWAAGTLEASLMSNIRWTLSPPLVVIFLPEGYEVINGTSYHLNHQANVQQMEKKFCQALPFKTVNNNELVSRQIAASFPIMSLCSQDTHRTHTHFTATKKKKKIINSQFREIEFACTTFAQ